MNNNQQKCGFVTLIGETNSGKSTLVNSFIGTKISIVSHKVQTTRQKILGIYTQGCEQIIFVDTPGVFKPSREFDSQMVSTAYSALNLANIILLVVDCNKGLSENLLNIIKKLQIVKQPAALVINKIDLIAKPKLLELTQKLNELYNFSQVFMISALKQQHLSDVLLYIKQNLPLQPWIYDEDEISDTPLNIMATEITRERIYYYLHQELPYSIIVKPEVWQETKTAITVKQVIYVISESHKKMVIGNHGTTIKNISMSARKELEKILNSKVNLFLHVKVQPNLFNSNNIDINS